MSRSHLTQHDAGHTHSEVMLHRASGAGTAAMHATLHRIVAMWRSDMTA